MSQSLLAHSDPEGSPEPADDPLAEAREAAINAHIVDLYVSLLDRLPGVDERAEWAAALRAGLTGEAMRQAVRDSDEYRAHASLAQASAGLLATGLFDPAWYLATYKDVAEAGLDPVAHYCQNGQAEDRAPNAYLNPVWYRAAHGLARDADILRHYLDIGEKVGMAPGPDFDPIWYRAVYEPPEDSSPLAHFLACRTEEDVAPCARLWSARLLRTAGPTPPGHDPFSHFSSRQPPAEWPSTPDLELIRHAGVFDENYYALHSADVLEAAVDPLEHFCRFGWREGRDPNFYFKTTWYSATNPDLVQLGINPLIHYLFIGEPAGRRPIVFFDPAWYRQHYAVEPGLSCLAHYLMHRRSQKVSPHPLFDPEYYMARCETVLHPRRDPFSHFLIAGMQSDVPPSADFDPAAWRRRSRGRASRHFQSLLSPEKDNPLINYLLSTYV